MGIIRTNIKTGKAMCKRSTIGTYLRVNALQNNAQSFFSLEYMFVGHYL